MPNGPTENHRDSFPPHKDVGCHLVQLGSIYSVGVSHQKVRCGSQQVGHGPCIAGKATELATDSGRYDLNDAKGSCLKGLPPRLQNLDGRQVLGIAVLRVESQDRRFDQHLFFCQIDDGEPQWIGVMSQPFGKHSRNDLQPTFLSVE